jgi:predicted peroxiredoxin
MATIKVFLSHASEDTDRLVKPFARALRAKSVDVWVDFWEIRDGDSLVTKIFEEGIGQAEAVLVIVSKYSVHKAWVEKELNVAVVRQIEKGIRLIPIVLDDQEVPVALQDTKYVKIRDPEHFQTQSEELVMSLHGYTDERRWATHLHTHSRGSALPTSRSWTPVSYRLRET